MRCNPFVIHGIVCLFLVVRVASLKAQDFLRTQDFESFIEDYGELYGDEQLSDWYDELLEYWEQPLNLNTIDEESIRALPMLNLYEKESLIAYLQRYRPLHAVSELLLVKGWTPLTLQKVRSFVYVGDEMEQVSEQDKPHSLSFGRWQVKQKNNLRLGKIDGDSAYLGPRLSNAYQLSFQSKPQWQMGLSIDKDEGEAWMDHVGVHFEHKGNKCLQHLLLGDYRVNFGQGLLISSGAFGGKSQALQQWLSGNLTFKVHKSCAESGFYRGAAAKLQVFPQASLAVFASFQKIDVNLKDSVFTSLKTDGLHRTEKEAAKRKNADRWVGGLRFQSRHGQFQWAANALHYRFGAEWQPEWQAYNQFYFRGLQGGNFSLDWRWRLGDWFCGGESAIDHQGHWAAIGHLSGRLNQDVQLSLSLRKFQPKYQAPFASAFSEKSGVNNEEGIFLAGIFRLMKGCDFRCFVDVYRFEWLRYGVNAPSNGWNAQLEADWRPNDTFSFGIRYKEKFQSENLPAAEAAPGVRELQDGIERQAKVQMVLEQASWRFKTSVQIAKRRFLGNSNGRKQSFCFAQDLAYKPEKEPIGISLQYALFDSDQGMAAYLYTPDLAGSMPFSSFYGKGQGVNLLVNYRHSQWLQIHLRAKSVLYQGESARTSIGSVLTFKF